MTDVGVLAISFDRLALGVLVAILSSGCLAQDPTWGLRGGMGTDLTGGATYGVGLTRMVEMDGTPIELGGVVFGASVGGSNVDSFQYHEESTDVFVLAATANFLVNYQPQELYFLSGIGVGLISMDWEEYNPVETTAGPVIGATHSEEGTAAGAIVNLGVGYQMSDDMDLRFEAPVFIMSSAPGEAASVVTTFVFTAGIRF